MTADFLVDSINGVTEGSSGLSKEWVGLILLPIVGNAAEHVTAVTVSVKDKLNLSIGVAVGSSIVRNFGTIIHIGLLTLNSLLANRTFCYTVRTNYNYWIM